MRVRCGGRPSAVIIDGEDPAGWRLLARKKRPGV